MGYQSWMEQGSGWLERWTALSMAMVVLVERWKFDGGRKRKRREKRENRGKRERERRKEKKMRVFR